MRANLEVIIATLCVASAAMAQTPNPGGAGAVGGVQAAVAQQPAVAPQPQAVASAPTLARPSDTIGEAADRQRMARMLATQSRPTVATTAQPTPVAAPIVGGISVERAPAGPAGTQMRPSQPEMALIEILRGPKATVVAIEVAGVERRVAEGDDLGNGWKVKKVGRFTVELEGTGDEGQPIAESPQSKAKAKTARTKKPLKTQTLSLRAPSRGALDQSSQPAIR
ncbi:hypothetical protein RQP54_18430 [Curvibacter sp. APW13]|uniref:hypothetical protein n=1 Tax=Curvibacter sp. APW13 TaxID=3077236 RepID=UPI0028DEE566|nr:hypothetical protein [Curvibacter sp. APW13]MDT8992857.1 hypothetical protein [Curvibacter sp. APW13]